jgi:hypothetical protein
MGDLYVSTRRPLCDDDEKGDINHESKRAFTTIDFPHAILTVANSINPRRDIVGWYYPPRMVGVMGICYATGPSPPLISLSLL